MEGAAVGLLVDTGTRALGCLFRYPVASGEGYALNSGALWPLALYFALAVALAAIMLGLSYFLGQRHRQPDTGKPYEGGIEATGSARLRYDIKYYMVAMFFVVFDLEAAFVFAWAAAVREVGWAGYLEVVVFIGILAATLVYLWRVGALEWGTGRRRP